MPEVNPVTFTGSGTITLGSTSFNNLIISATGTYTITDGITTTGDFTQTSGIFVADPTETTFSVGGNFSLQGGEFNRFTGSGTGTDPYFIYDIYGLQGMGEYLSNTFGLHNSIDASIASSWNSGAGFAPIGNSSTPFSGTFNGNSYTISNLFIDLPSTDNVGLFGYTTGATIENVGLVNDNIIGQNYVGGLVGWSSSSSIFNSYATGSVSGNNGVGGLVGTNYYSSSIDNSYTTGSASGSGNCTGGLVGYNGHSSSIDNSYATGSVSGFEEEGGLAGQNSYSGSIDNSYATGSVSGSAYVGGLVGGDYISSIANSYATGNVSSSSGNYVGGLAGFNWHSSSIVNSYATGSVSGSGDKVGGLVGYNAYSSSIANSYATGSVSGSGNYVGGLVGYNISSSSIVNSYATGSVTGGSNVGGLIGYDDTSNTLTNNWWYNSLSNGIGNYGPDISAGQWQEAGSASDFYSSSQAVYSTWDFNGLWKDGAGITYPTLIWQDMNNGSFIGGTDSIPFLIHDVNQLQFMGYALSDSFQLASDIDASATSGWNSGAGFSPVGNSTTPFTGIFNGNNYTISNLFINLPTTDNVGLFGYTKGAAIENVGLINANVTGQNNVGALVGYNNNSSSIDNSYATGTVIGSSYSVGGLVGSNHNSSSIDNSYATGSVSGNGIVGGLVGANNYSSSIDNSYASGTVVGTGYNVGGLVGINFNLSSIDNSFATGSVSGSGEVGGLVGSNGLSSIDNSYATGTVSGTIQVGGLVGGNYSSSSIDNSFAVVNASGSSNVGGLIGYDDGSNTLTNNWWYNSLSNGIGNYGPDISVGHWQEAGSVADFYSPLNPVYAIGTPGGWDIFTPLWDTYTDELPHLHWEHHAGDLNPYWLGTTSSDFDTASNWSTNSVPGSSSTVIIARGTNEPTLSGITTLDNFLIGSGTFTQDATLTLSGDYVQVGGTYNQNAALSIGGNFAQGGGAFVSNPADTFTVGNSFSLSGGTFSRFTGLGIGIDPYLIYDVYGLQGMGGFFSSTFGLGQNIDASVTSSWNSGTGFIPVGIQSTPFTGTFNGNNYTISDLFINLPLTNYVGLFGYTYGATIENVGLLNANITGQNNVGALVGYNNNSNIDNSYATGSVSGSNDVGGLVGNNIGSIANSYAAGSVSGSGSQVGGLAGNNIGSIANSYATGSVCGANYVGGLVGVNQYTSSIDNSYATGNVSGSSYVGGLVGSNWAGSSIDNSYATGSVSGSSDFVGGLVGENNNSSSIDNSYATGNVSGIGSVGGLVGYNNYSSISNSYATGSVSGTDYVGGLVGEIYDGRIDNSYATGSVSGSSRVGGLIGGVLFDAGSISNSYYTDSNHQNGLGTFDPNGAADFYSPANPVYAIGSAGGWNIFSPVWDTYTNELPHLHWENHSGSMNPLWLGTSSSDFDTASNWSTDSVPGSSSTVIIASGTNEPILNETTTLANFIIGSGTFNQDATLTLSGNYGQVGGTYNQNAALSIGGNFSQGGGAFVSNPANTFTVGNNFSLTGGTFSRFTGLGTGSDPYLIYDVYGLQGMRGFLSSTFGLHNDIDASATSNWNSGEGFIPIGKNLTPFTGTFNGNNYTTSNLFINFPSMDDVGLFGYISGATIENVGLLNASITGQDVVGSLVGGSYNSSKIDNSYATGGVSGQFIVGGLVGTNYSSSNIDNSYATGSVNGSSTYVGGLVGLNRSSSIANSYATGSVSGSGSFDVGGLVGANYYSGSIDYSYATGSVSGSGEVGGLVGSNDNSSSIANSYATGSVSGTGNVVGGLVGSNNSSSSIANSYATGSVSGSSQVGGLVGYNRNSSSIDNSYSTGTVSGSSNVGGLIGYDDTSNTLTNNWWYNSLSNGIGNYGPDTSSGHWQEAGSASDFYSTSQAVYTGSPTWDFNGLWKDGAGVTYPTLIWQGMSNGFFIGGTESIPFLIHNVNQLQFMGYALSDFFQLATDIDANATSGWNSGAGFTPIGNYYTTQFIGTFNGNNYTISNLFINLQSTNFVGLFGSTSGATIENIGLVNVNITGQYTVGALVGYNNNSSRIINSYATGSVGGSGGVGGLVGYNAYSSSIDNSYAIGNVSGGYRVGGLVGYNYSSSRIANSYATGSVSGSGYAVGGLVGYNIKQYRQQLCYRQCKRE